MTRRALVLAIVFACGSGALQVHGQDPVRGPDESAALGGLGALIATAQPRDPELFAASLAPGFVDQLVVGDLGASVGLDFAPDGRAYVWDLDGRVRIVDDGVLQAEPFLDITEEVRRFADLGLISLALDPDFHANGHVYLLYAVDHHHLVHFGTASYDPQVSDLARDSIGRVTRYTADSGDDFRSVVPGSRLVLLGEDPTTGIPLCSTSHGPGSLAFGTDGSLIVSTGDSDASPGSGTCLSDGILKPKEAVGRFRSQLVDSLCGKLLRLDPATGDGLPSNPFYDPRAPRSRVWTLGLRQPFRMTCVPGSGSADPALGDPGTLIVGDVGAVSAEELSVVSTGGLNCGWPIYEGLSAHPIYASELTPNLDASNPLFGVDVPGMGFCTQEFFDFQDLLVQDSLNPPLWSNACDPGQPVATDVPLFQHHRPALEWLHSEPDAHVPVYDAFGEADVAHLGEPGTPVAGEAFGGLCSVGGTWYDGTAFPVEYQGTYFHADFGVGWIRQLTFGAGGDLQSVDLFADGAGFLVDMDVHPVDGGLYFIDLTSLGQAQLRRVVHVTGNALPTASASASPSFGEGPLTVAFDGTASSDPEGGELSHAWSFDGLPPSRLASPVRVLPSEDITAAGTIVTKLFDLVPPAPMGISNPDPEVIRDGVYPPADSTGVLTQYDTAHWDGGGVPDKAGEDWIGYVFAEEHDFHGLVYQEGILFLGLQGGYWNALEIQVRQGGVWVTVPEVQAELVYPGDIVPHYELFEYRFGPVTGDGLRLYGVPGGSLEFITVGELRVLAVPDGPHRPTNVGATLVVTDDAGGAGQAGLDVSVDNTPPVAQILTPVHLSNYSTDVPMLATFSGVASDAEHLSGELSCGWQVILHHDAHNHPGPVDSACQTTAVLPSDGCPEVHWVEVRYSVTDPLGLSTTISHLLMPECDQNHNGVDDALDIAGGASADDNANGIPDEAESDCNNDGIPDIHQLFVGELPDVDGNGIPDGCEGLRPQVRQGSGPAQPPGALTPPPGGSLGAPGEHLDPH